MRAQTATATFNNQVNFHHLQDNKTLFLGLGAHAACVVQNETILRMVLSQKNVDLLLQDQQGNTALHVAAIYDFPEGVKLLLNEANELGCLDALLNTLDMEGRNALFQASFYEKHKS